MIKSKFRLLIIIVGICLVIIATAFYVVFKDELPQEDNSAHDKPASFTFFDIGATTRLTESLREALQESLGSDAIEKWTTVNLEILYNGFIQKNLPEIHDLNNRLNGQAGQRIEHNTIKLRYRYIPQKNYPFDYVELLFANYSQKPLYIKIQSEKEGKAIVDLLKNKYGKKPRRIDRDGQDQYSLIWEYKGDVLVYSNTPDKFGNPGYHIMIYYVGNIKQMLHQEREEARKAKRGERDLDTAF